MITCAGRNVVTGTIHLPRAGVWHADLEVDGTKELTGSVTVADEEISFVGSVYRSGELSDRTFVRIRGGAGGMSTVLPARSYVDVPVSVILADILSGAKETLASDAQAALTSLRLPHWTTVQGEAGTALQQLVQAAGGVWRIKLDGTVWVGVDSYPTQKIASLQRLDPDPIAATWVIAPDKLELRPGVTFDGRKVSRVEHQIHSDKIRTVYWAEESTGGFSLDRIKEPLARFVRWVMRDTRYHALYPATVQGQDSAGLLDLYPDDAIVRGTGTSKVPIRYGAPGVSAKVPVGARVMLGFANGDPQSPYAALWDTGAITSLSLDGGTQQVARVGDLVTAGGPGTVVTLTTMLPIPAPAFQVPPGTPIQALISFSAVPPTPVTAEPLYGSIASGAAKVLA